MAELQTLEELEDLLPGRQFSFAQADRDQHAADQSALLPRAPDVVVWPESTEDVRRLLEWANENQVAVTAWGAGTSLEGNPIPLRGGITLDLRRMNRILELHSSDLQVTVEAGALYKDMNAQLAKHGLFFPPDPGANASIGGMLANNAAGLRTVRYGATRDNTLALEVVLAGGAVIRTGSRAIKQSSGYALTDLFIGSEGTLGVITRATLRLAPVPAHIGAASVAFPNVAQAAEAVYDLMGTGLAPTALELLDRRAVKVMNSEPDLDLAEAPHLFVEFSAPSQPVLAEASTLAAEICRANDAITFDGGLGQQARDRLWQARYRIFESHQRVYRGHEYLLTDTCVPLSAFPAHVKFASAQIVASQLHGSIVCHAGDGNMHTVVFFPPEDEARRAKTEQLNVALVEHALELDGTVSGEHGIGLSKRGYMAAEHGAGSLNLMHEIKRTLDPHGILNPGKVLPEE